MRFGRSVTLSSGKSYNVFKNNFLDSVLGIASRPGSQWRGPRGHLNRTLIDEHLGQVDGQTFFVCGPPAFMRSMEEILMSLKVPADKILEERFMIDATLPASLDPSMCNVIFSKSGRQYVCSSADTLLTIAERHGIEVASNCRVGQCGSCATRVLDGDVEMETEEGPDPALGAQGYRLLCVGRARGQRRADSRPRDDRVSICH